MSDFFSYGGPPKAGSEGERREAPRAILGELSGEDWEKFITHTARRRYPAGAVIVPTGSTERALCFIASGQVELRSEATGSGLRARKSPVTLLGEGEVLGLLSFLDGAPSTVTATVSAAAPAELLMLSPEALQQLAAWQPRIAVALLRDLGAHVASRLRRLQPDA